MNDKEKVVKAWKIFRDSNPYGICDGREFRAITEPEYCMGQMIKDTITLLEEQEFNSEEANSYSSGYVKGYHDGFDNGFEAAKNVSDELIKQQRTIIERYHKADSFLAVHGWKWE